MHLTFVANRKNNKLKATTVTINNSYEISDTF